MYSARDYIRVMREGSLRVLDDQTDKTWPTVFYPRVTTSAQTPNVSFESTFPFSSSVSRKHLCHPDKHRAR